MTLYEDGRTGTAGSCSLLLLLLCDNNNIICDDNAIVLTMTTVTVTDGIAMTLNCSSMLVRLFIRVLPRVHCRRPQGRLEPPKPSRVANSARARKLARKPRRPSQARHRPRDTVRQSTPFLSSGQKIPKTRVRLL